MADDEKEPAATTFSGADAFRRMQELGAQLTGAARSIAENLTSSPAAAPFAEPMARWGERTVELSTLWVAPMRAMLEEQQQLIDAVASWAEEQRNLADRFSALAARHREMTEQVLSTITPALEQVERLTGRAPSSSAKSSSKSKTSKPHHQAKKS
jgi:methyl-accepting chemotaxis protein